MNRPGWRSCIFALFCVSFFLLTSQVQAKTSEFNAKLSYWDIQRKGTNQFNTIPTESWFAQASKANIEWVRLTFGKWRSESGDFLAGNLDNYQALNQSDLDKLTEVIGWAEKYDLKVVLTPLELPGNRWVQNNNGIRDQRLWSNKLWWEQSARYWQDIASALKDTPTIVAYNIINEPTPEMGTELPEHGDPVRYPLWYQEHRGTSRDLPAFYNFVIKAIRDVDTTTPIMVDSGWYAQAQAFTYWPKLDDNKVLYSFHMYEPFNYTHRSNYQRQQNGLKTYSYPGMTPYAGDVHHWDKAALNQWLTPFFRWAHHQNIPPSRLVAGEFGAYRMNPGADKYLEDLISIFNQQNIHWAFYSFREDEWDGYDYETGQKKLGWQYWEAMEKGENPERPRDNTNPLWEVIDQALNTAPANISG